MTIVQVKVPRHRKPSLDRLIRQAEKAGKQVSSITTAEGVTLRFDKPNSMTNLWDKATDALMRKQ